MKRLPALALIVVWNSGSWAQTQPGVIQGIVLSPDGNPVPRANIYYGRTGRLGAKAASAVLPPVLAVKAGHDGRFTLMNLPAGGWTVCAQAAGFLDPCHWSAAPTFTLNSGQQVSNATVRMEAAYSLQIHVDDPQGLLSNEGRAAGALLQIGVHAPSGAFHRAKLAGRDSKGRDYTIEAPARGTAKLYVLGGRFQLNDEGGLPLPVAGKVVQVTAPSSSASNPGAPGQYRVRFSVTGLRP